MSYIQFTPESFVQFNVACLKCKPGKTFMFEGKEVLKEYAELIIEYVEANCS